MKLNNRYYALLCGLTFVSLSCAQQTLEVLEPWVRIPPPGMNMLAGYGEFTNSSNSTIELVSAQSENFKSISFHISEIVDGISKMTKLEKIEGIELMRALELGLKIGTFIIKGSDFAVDVNADLFKAIDLSGFLSATKRPTSSPAKCWLSDALPPLPHQKIVLSFFKHLISKAAVFSIDSSSS